MASKGWTTAQEVADVAGVSRSAAAQWLGQGSKIIHTIGKQQAAENLEKSTGFCALWIAKGIGPKYVTQQRYGIPNQNRDAFRLGESPAEQPWPLKKSTPERIHALAPTQQKKLDDVIDAVLKGFEAEGK